MLYETGGSMKVLIIERCGDILEAYQQYIQYLLSDEIFEFTTILSPKDIDNYKETSYCITLCNPFKF